MTKRETKTETGSEKDERAGIERYRREKKDKRRREP